VIILANLGNINPGDLCHKVADIFLPPIAGGTGPAAAAAAVDTATARRLDGDYWDHIRKVRLKFESYTQYNTNLGGLSLNGIALRAVNDSVYRNPSNGTEYRFSTAGDPITMVSRAPGTTDRRFEKVKKVTFSLKSLEEYTGMFYSKELDVRYSLFMKDYALQVKTPRNDASELKPFIKDVFFGPFVMEVQRDKKGKVSGFLLSTGRSRNIKFEKM